MTGQQLKNSILQIAVQGKLVPQNPNDEPAGKLLDKIKAEKEKLIKEGKIKKDKNESLIYRGDDGLFYERTGKQVKCIQEEIPFDVPESWEWCRLGEIFQHNTGKALNSSNQIGEKMKYITTSNLYWNRFELDNLRTMFFTDSEIEKCTVKKGDLLVCEGGDVGRAAVWSLEQNMCIQNHIHRLRPYIKVCIDFFYFLFYFYKHIGMIGGKGIGIKGLSSNALHNLIIPLPPLKEQQRIVDKISSILPYVDEYGDKENELSKLSVEFPDKLKKSILQYAVQGKLVPQNPHDEPASRLLEKIRAEKEKLIKEGKIKKDKNESFIFRGDDGLFYEKTGKQIKSIQEEIPFDLPESWEWTRLGSIVNFVGGYAYKSSDFIQNSNNQVLRLGNVKNNFIKYSANPVFISDELAEKTSDFKCREFDILITMTGTRLKRDYFYSVIVQKNEPCLYINQRVGCLRSILNQISLWILYAIKSEAILNQVFKYETGTANQGNLGAENILKLFIPIPPLDEQYRIVTELKKYDSLIQDLQEQNKIV